MDKDQQKWYALYTKSRHEDVVFEGMKKKVIEAFVPKVEISEPLGKHSKQSVDQVIGIGFLMLHEGYTRSSTGELMLQFSALIVISPDYMPESFPMRP